MSTGKQAARPGMVFHVVEHVQEEIEERGWSREEFGRRAGLSEEEVADLWACKLRITPLVAGKIGGALGIGAALLLNLDGLWRKHFGVRSYPPWLRH